jgi:hypothetical protein
VRAPVSRSSLTTGASSVGARSKGCRFGGGLTAMRIEDGPQAEPPQAHAALVWGARSAGERRLSGRKGRY